MSEGSDAVRVEGRSAQRIAVLGCSGSGKSTLAAALDAKLDLPYVATDAVFWTDSWRPTPTAEVRAWLSEIVAQARWVTDGNFDDDRDLLWDRADLIVWLDLPLAVVLAQVLRRNLTWWLRRQPVWGGQRMTLPKALGGARHMLRSHGVKRAAYPAWLAACAAPQVIRLRTRADLARWFASLSGVR